MYNELYEAWRREKENAELQLLPKNFYAKIAEYMKKIREESRMLDEKTTKARLLMHESTSVRRMIKELLLLRYGKAVEKMSAGEMMQKEVLTREEEKLVKEVAPSFEFFQSLSKDVLGGHLPTFEDRKKTTKQVLRFLKEVPSIIGADMKVYGPFKPEDIASLPQENAGILVKQGMAIEVEVKL